MKARKQENPFEKLPDELILYIADKMACKDIGTMSQVSRQFHRIAKEALTECTDPEHRKKLTYAEVLQYLKNNDDKKQTLIKERNAVRRKVRRNKCGTALCDSTHLLQGAGVCTVMTTTLSVFASSQYHSAFYFAAGSAASGVCFISAGINYLMTQFGLIDLTHPCDESVRLGESDIIAINEELNDIQPPPPLTMTKK